MAIPVPAEQEPEFLEAIPVPAKNGFQCNTGILAGTVILLMKFLQKLKLQKSKDTN